MLCLAGALAEPARVKLGSWSFESLNWASDAGRRPLLATNISWVASTNLEGKALKIIHPDGGLAFRSDGEPAPPLLGLDTGTIHLWYLPFWRSLDAESFPEGITPPGRGMRLFEAADSSDAPPLVAISINANGNVLSIESRSPSGGKITNLTAKISVNLPVGAPRWQEITFSYTRTNCALFLGGVGRAYGSGIALPVSVKQRDVVVVFGNTKGGGAAAQGLIDQAETWNYPMTALGVGFPGAWLNAEAVSEPPSIHFSWARGGSDGVSMDRREGAGDSWRNVLTNFAGLSWNDRNVARGKRYFYRWRPAGSQGLHMSAGLEAQAIEDRGAILLVVDETLPVEPGMEEEIAAFQSLLIGDGWKVQRIEAARQDDRDWSANPPAIARLKKRIIEAAAAEPALKGLILLGHVAVPYTGMTAEDGHFGGAGSHYGAWASDLYYGDLDGTWTDTLNYTAQGKPAFTETPNGPGDGKFDQNFIPTNSLREAKLELFTGRIDFARLTKPGTPPLSARRLEVSRIKDYLRKNARYRMGEIEWPKLVTVMHGFNPGQNGSDMGVLAEAARLNAGMWFGDVPEKLLEMDSLLGTQPALWTIAGGFGGPNGLTGYRAGPVISEDVLSGRTQPAFGFGLFLGSYFGDFNAEADFLRALLTSPNSGLATMWMRHVPWRLGCLGNGGCLGQAQLETANDPTVFPNGGPRWLSIMGDPTLRQTIPPAPGKVIATPSSKEVGLAWSMARDGGCVYHVYRSTNGLSGPFDRLTAQPLTVAGYVDQNPPLGPKTYSVRASQLVRTGSGSHHELSQARFVSAP